MKFMEQKRNTGRILKTLSIAPSLLFIAACSGGGGAAVSEPLPGSFSANTQAKVGVFMETDLANPSSKRVIVSVNSVSLRSGSGESISSVNFSKEVELTLNEFGLPNLTLDEGQSFQAKEIRLMLNEFGNKYIFPDGTMCNLQTPSAQQSGLKIKLPEGFVLTPGLHYSVQLAFNVEKSIVEQGNNGCLLKPVIKAKIISYRPIDDGSSDGGSTTGGEINAGSSDGGSTTGGETNAGSSDGGSTTGGETNAGSSDGGSTTGGDDGSGEGVQPINDVVYQPADNQVVDILEIEVSN